jgi:hypothetical protein
VTKERLKSDKKKIDVGKKAARDTANEPLEIRIKSFKEMLAEKEIILRRLP